jgi:glycosyltransferase involved in cell wall biosynthesis
MEKIKVLVYADFIASTGFGGVASNIVSSLYDTGKYEFTIFAINYHGVACPEQHKYKLYPASLGSNDPYGRSVFPQFAENIDFDILFVLQDSFIVSFLPGLIKRLSALKSKPFKVITYFPVDSTLKESWVDNIKDSDSVVAFTEFGKKAYQKYDSKSVTVIPHGINIADFHPVKKGAVKNFRAQYFGNKADKFIFTIVARNQIRKDIPRAMMAFKEFNKKHKDSILYLHMASKDQGWDIKEVMVSLGLTDDQVIFPHNFNVNSGFPINVLNLIYNASDVVMLSCVGEGWGLSATEAMACKTPVIMPNNTVIPEIVTEDRGYLVDSGSNINLFTVLSNDSDVVRPLVDINSLVDTMEHVYLNYEEAKGKAETAYKWIVNDLQWSGKIKDMWEKEFSVKSSSIKLKENTIGTELF